MNIALLDFQVEYVADLLVKLNKAKKHVNEGELEGVLLSAPTGSGKTVMITDLIEKVLFGTDGFNAEPEAVFLWLSDQPELNEQSRSRILSASSRLREHHLVVVGSEFDQERFEGGKVYFLNTQKLGKDKNLTTKGDSRTWTIWETIQSSFTHLGSRFYLVIDEAHRGMNKSKQQDEEAKTIAQKFLTGSNGTIKPVPLVIGISATPERFERLVERRGDRHIYPVYVDVAKVRDSGLLKDQLTVFVPNDVYPTDWSLLKAGAERWKKMRDEWREYCHSQGIPIVSPILVIQVEDGTSRRLTNTDLDAAIQAIEEAVGSVSNEEIGHCFQEDHEVVTQAHKIRYIAPSKVASDLTAKFVFFKMALTTGWDCPRAEVMMSFRKAVDATLIAQLVGRMVRTPLARRIEGNETLNEVHLYLPHYDEQSLTAIVDRLQKDSENVPTVPVRSGRDYDELRVPEHLEPVRKLLNSLPNYLVKGQKQPDYRRLMRFVTLLTIRDGLDEQALELATRRIVNTMTDKRNTLVAGDEDFRSQVSGLGRIKLKPLHIDQQSYEMTVGSVETVEVSDQNVDDLFGLAEQRLGGDLAVAYLKANHDNSDPHKAKLELYLLLQRADVITAVESTARTLITSLKAKHQASINEMESSRRARYDDIWARARKPEQVSFTLPREITLPKSKSGAEYAKHLYVDASGKFRAELGGWEEPVLQAELPSCVAWFRNLPNKPWAIAFPYQMDGQTKPGFPDFLTVRVHEHGLVPDILEPHNPALADAWAKAKGLAEFADRHGTQFGRIEMQQIRSGRIVRLDFQDIEIRERALRLTSSSDLNNLFVDLGR